MERRAARHVASLHPSSLHQALDTAAWQTRQPSWPQVLPTPVRSLEYVGIGLAVPEADCALSIQGLSALVYGAHDPGDFQVRGWGDPSPDTLATMRVMFPQKLAYLHEWF